MSKQDTKLILRNTLQDYKNKKDQTAYNFILDLLVKEESTVKSIQLVKLYRFFLMPGLEWFPSEDNKTVTIKLT